MKTTYSQQIVEKLKRQGIIPDKKRDQQIADLERQAGGQLRQGDTAPNTRNVWERLAEMADQGLPVPKEMTPEQVAALRAKGYNPSYDEIKAGIVATNAPTKTFKAVSSQPTDPYADAVAEAERQLESERLSKMTDREADLYLAKKAQLEKQLQAANDQVKAAHLAAHKSILDTLNKIRLQALSDTDFSSDDVELIEAAIIQRSTVGGDEETANVLIEQVAAIPGRIRDDHKAALAVKLEAAGLSSDEVKAAVASRFPEQAKIEPVENLPTEEVTREPSEFEKKFDAFYKRVSTVADARKAYIAALSDYAGTIGTGSDAQREAAQAKMNEAELAWKSAQSASAAV